MAKIEKNTDQKRFLLKEKLGFYRGKSDKSSMPKEFPNQKKLAEITYK